MSERIDLLRRFLPQLRYDSNEQYFVGSAEQWTANPGNELRRAAVDGRDREVIARAVPRGSEPALTLEFLGPETYANGEPAQVTDVIGLKGRDYREQYVRLRTERPELNDVVYGRAVEDNGRLWLQYWLWYFYNDYQLALGAGLHEGDWEMVMLRMHGDEPDIAVYMQHGYGGEKRLWEEVEKDGDAPIVYVARGSHASYFEAGFHQTEAWYDLADGKRRAPRSTLQIIGDDEERWMSWPGRWGDTVAHDNRGLHSGSPVGPARSKQWRNPNAMLDDATVTTPRTLPRAPDVDVARDGGVLRIDYDFTRRATRPSALVVTVNSSDEKLMPPRTHTFESFHASGKGSLLTEIALDPAKHYDVYTSTVEGDPPKPSASRFGEIDPVGTGKPTKLVQKQLEFISGVVARLRGDR